MEYVSYAKALSDLISSSRIQRRVRKASVRESVGLTCAVTVGSRADVPEFDTSHMDGYAVCISEKNEYTVVGEIKLGERPRIKLKKGEAVRVTTGCYLPDGTDAVLRVEQTEVREGKLVHLGKAEHGQYIYRRGSDISKGEFIIKKGETLLPKHIPSLLSTGVDYVDVFEKPRVGIISTGSELSDERIEGKVLNTHAPMLVSLLERLGCEPVYYGIAGDDLEEIKSFVSKSIGACDVTLLTGGTSMGGKDLTVQAVSSLRPKILYHGIKIDRGRVSALAVVKGKPVIMLPGPVQATLNAIILFFIPLIDMFYSRKSMVSIGATLSNDWKARKGFEDFTKVVYLKLSFGRSIKAETVAGPTESNSVLLRSNAVAILDEKIESIKKGERITALLLPGMSF